MSATPSQAGKGDAPRNCFSKKFRDNYDDIVWNHKDEKNNNNSDVSNDVGVPVAPTSEN